MKRLIAPILFLAFTAIAIVGCKKLDDPLPVDRLKSILLGKDTVTMYAGEKRSVPVTISPSNYSLDSIRWKSLDTNIISISKLGLITAKKPGMTTVSVSNMTNTISVNCKIVVKDSLWADLIAYYPFNNSGVDSSGNKNDVFYYRDITSTTNRFGKANSAFSFNGTSSYMVVADKAALRLSNTDFTVSVWAKPAEFNSSSGSFIMSKRRPGFNNGWGFSITGATSGLGPSGMIFFGPGGNVNDAVSNQNISLNNWHLATVTYSVATLQMRMYINGVLVNTVNNIPSPNGFINSSLYIGSDNLIENATTYFYKGVYDDIRIYGRALSAKEVDKLFKATN
jgi:hypothetical protein